MDNFLLSIFPTINAAYVFIGSVVLGASGGLLGSFAVLRRQGLLSDTLAHASLPGIVLAFLIIRSKFLPGLLLGALIFGLLGAAAVYYLVNHTKTKMETAMASVLSVFFALGIVLLSYVQGLPLASQAGLNDFLFGKAAGLLRDDVIWMMSAFVLVLILIVLLWKELKLFVFDKEFAAVIGFRRGVLEILFNSVFVLTILISLQAVGVILTAAIFITPAMTAYMWTYKFSLMVVVSTVLGMLAGAIGAYMSAVLPNLPTGPVIVLALSSFFIFSFLFSNRKGIIWKWIRSLRRAKKVHFENLVAKFYREYEAGKRRWKPKAYKTLLLRRGLFEREGKYLILSKQGIIAGAKIIEKHRLWETYLVNKWQLPPDHVHRDAHDIEHILNDEVVKDLYEILDKPQEDPHGESYKFKPIAMTELFVLIIIVLTGMTCALIGNFLVLRRMALVGDAMSHSMLPGILLAFFITGTLESPLFFFFAAVFAVLMSLMVDFLIEKVGIFQESAIGIVFTFLFSVGVVLLVQFAGTVHIDTHAVLYGNAEFAAFEKLFVMGKNLGPRALWIMGLMFLVNLTAVILMYKEWKVSIFDKSFSRSVGISPRFLHYLLIALTSLTVVSAFEIVGVVLVVALLIVPGATAHLLSSKLWQMIVFSLLCALFAAVGGFFLAINMDLSLSGSVALMSGILMAIVALTLHLRR